MKTLEVSMDYDGYGALVANCMVRPTLVDQIKGKQMQDDELVKKVYKMMNSEIGENFWITQDGVLTMKGRVIWKKVDHGRSTLLSVCYASE